MARPRQVSDEAIVEAARRCFLEHGAGVSTTRIAEEVGLSQAALFKRFGTKADLLQRALLPPAVPEWIAAVEQGLDDRPIPEQLANLATAIATFFRDYIPCLMTLRASGHDIKQMLASRYEVPPPVRARLALITWFDEAIAQGRMRSVDSSATAEALIGSLQGHAFLSHMSGMQPDPERFAHCFVDLLWRGLEPEPAR